MHPDLELADVDHGGIRMTGLVTSPTLSRRHKVRPRAEHCSGTHLLPDTVVVELPPETLVNLIPGGIWQEGPLSSGGWLMFIEDGSSKALKQSVLTAHSVSSCAKPLFYVARFEQSSRRCVENV